MRDALLVIGGIAAVFALAYWYIEVYTTRKHWREAVEETDAQFDREYGPGWRGRAKRRQIPPREMPPSPPPCDALQAEAIRRLLAVARAAFTAAENGEDDGDADRIHYQRADVEALNTALDALDELPDDQRGVAMSGPAAAEWALRALFAETPT
jgi:hypothetical protein